MDVVRCCDALTFLADLPDDSVQLVVTDPPYYRFKAVGWDRQWQTEADYLAWMGELCAEWSRVLAPNGSLYVFASPQMAWAVEGVVREHMRVLTRITWLKGPQASGGKWATDGVTDLRAPFPRTEAILFAEQFGQDSTAHDAAGYASACEQLRGKVFTPLRLYLEGERRRAGIDKVATNVACGFSPTPGGMASRKYFSRSQWCLPTADHYASLQALFNAEGRQPAPPFENYHDADARKWHVGSGEHLRADYEDLRADYEDLRAEFERLRRPFNATRDAPYTDVWEFNTVRRKGKHICEKPLDMARHIVTLSSRPGDTVLDCFAGSGVFGQAAVLEGRKFLGCEVDPEWALAASERVERADPAPARPVEAAIAEDLLF